MTAVTTSRPGSLPALAVAALLVAGCAVTPPLVAPPAALVDAEQTPEWQGDDGVSIAELVALADDLTAALNDTTPEMWVSYFAADLQRDAEMWWISVQAVPMEMREVHVIGRTRARTETGPTRAVLAFRHQITGVDPHPLVQRYEVSVDSAAGSVAEFSRWSAMEVLPWDWEGEVVVRESAAAVLLVDERWEWAADQVFAGVDRSVAAVTDDLPPVSAGRVLLSVSDSSQVDYSGRMIWLGGGSTVAQALGGLATLTGTQGHRILVDVETLVDQVDYLGGDARLPTATAAAVVTLAQGELGPHTGVQWAKWAVALWYSDGVWHGSVPADRAVLEASYLENYVDLAGELPQQLPPAGNSFLSDDLRLLGANQVSAMLIFLFIADVWDEQTALDLTWQLATARSQHSAMELVVADVVGMSVEEFEREYVVWVADRWGGQWPR